MSNVVIVSAKRTAVGAFGGSLKDVAAKDLGALVMREVLLSCGLRPEMPDHAMADAPDRIKPKELAPVEKEYFSWPEGNKGLAIDQVVVGSVREPGVLLDVLVSPVCERLGGDVHIPGLDQRGYRQ